MSTESNKKIRDSAATWSLYWSQNRLHSCVASDNEADQKVINSLWHDVSAKLPESARVLDLATGNGAVPMAMLSHNPSLSIDAVDRANINPQQFLPELELLKSVRFHGGSDILDLSFAPNTYDAITSQYGVEYAGLMPATEKILPLLKNNGVMAFLVHHRDSGIIKSSAEKVTEMTELLRPDGLLDALMSVLKSEQEFQQLESLGQQYLDSDSPKTQQISGQVFAGIEHIAKAMPANMPEALNMGATLRLRLESELERLEQMTSCAQSEKSIADLCSFLESQGLSIESNKAVFVNPQDNEYLLGQLIIARKTN